MENAFVILFFIGMLIFFFPIFLETNVVIEDGRIMFSFYLYSFIRLLCGYVTFDKSAFTAHVSKTKAFYFPYNKMREEKALFDLLEGVQVMSVYVVAEVDINKDYALPACVFGETALRYIFDKISSERPYMNLGSDLLISDKYTTVAARATVLVNAFTLARVGLKMITGRIISAVWKKKQKNMKV